jgi:hypothetical protein
LFERNWNEKNDNEKCFGFLSKWCKTKKLGGAKCKKHKSFGKNFKISGGAPAPPHIHTAPPLHVLLFWETPTYKVIMI